MVDNVAETISKIAWIDELYEATGESELISLIIAPGLEQFREVRSKITEIRGVLNTGAAIVEKI
jgi:DNA-binding Lrp family transcriptional regulator